MASSDNSKVNLDELDFLIEEDTDHNKIVLTYIRKTKSGGQLKDELISVDTETLNKNYIKVLNNSLNNFYSKDKGHGGDLERFIADMKSISKLLLNQYTTSKGQAFLNRIFSADSTRDINVIYKTKTFIPLEFLMLTKISSKVEGEQANILNSFLGINFRIKHILAIDVDIDEEDNFGQEIKIKMNELSTIFSGWPEYDYYDLEYTAICTHLQEISSENHVKKIDFFENLADVENRLLKGNSNILHLCTHSDKENIYFSSNSEDNPYITLNTMDIGHENNYTHIIFYNMCNGAIEPNDNYSFATNTLHGNTASCVISNYFTVPDSIAYQFADSFYDRLGKIPNQTGYIRPYEVISTLRRDMVKQKNKFEPYILAYISLIGNNDIIFEQLPPKKGKV